MSNQYITSIGLFYKNVGILLGGLSDCEELVGVTFRGMMGLVLDRADFQGLPERRVSLYF